MPTWREADPGHRSALETADEVREFLVATSRGGYPGPEIIATLQQPLLSALKPAGIDLQTSVDCAAFGLAALDTMLECTWLAYHY